MKFILISILLAVGLCQETIDGVVAVVGNNIITQSEFFEQLTLISQKRGISPQSSPLLYEKTAKKLLDNLINQYVLLEHAKKDTNIFIEDSQVKEQLEMQIEGFVKELGSVEALEKYFKKNIRDIKSYYWEEIYNAMMIEKFRYSILSSVSVEKKEVYIFYENIKDSIPPVPKSADFSVLNIFYVPSKETTGGYINFMNSIKDSINKKLFSFEEMVLKHSEDLVSAKSGGLVGETVRGSFFQEYEEAAFSTQINSVVGPIKTQAGLHLIKLIDKKGEKITTKHLLKTIKPSNDDKKNTIETINSVYETSLSDKDYLYNYIEENKLNEGYTNNYKNYYYENMPQEIINFIDRSEEGGISAPFGLTNGSIVVVQLKSKKEAVSATVENSYEYISALAKEKKMSVILDDWLIKAKENVYINIFIEN